MKPFNKYFDHTLLKADATGAQIRQVLEEAREYDFASVCVNGCHIRTAAEFLKDTDVKVACVVGFPLGAQAPDAKSGEVRVALADGASEIDMVLNIGAARDGRWDQVTDEIRLLADLCHGAGGPASLTNAADQAALSGAHGHSDPAGTDPAGADDCADAPAEVAAAAPALLKVILETCLLTDEEIVRACRAAEEAGADFVKTSTGFSTGGATVHHVQLMKQAIIDWEQEHLSGQTAAVCDTMITPVSDMPSDSRTATISDTMITPVRPHMQIKASGGIRTLADARAMIDAGADRLGCSASVSIMQEYNR